MYKAIFEIYHKGCWGSSIGLKFPEYEFYSIDVRWIKGSVAHIIKSVGDPKQFDTIINYLKNHNDVKSIDILSRSESEIYMRSVTLNSSDHPNFSHNFFENNLILSIVPTINEKKFKK